MNDLGTQILKTDRLTLRKLMPEDAFDIYCFASDMRVSQFLSWTPHKNIDETRSVLAEWLEEYSKPYCYQWAIVYTQSNTVIGTISLWDVKPAERSAQLTYALHAGYWGMGIVTEACRAVLEYAFRQAGFYTIYAKHNKLNPASGKVMIKCGMRFTHFSQEQFDKVSVSGTYLNYRITREIL